MTNWWTDTRSDNINMSVQEFGWHKQSLGWYTIITTGHYFDLRTRSLIWLSRAILSLPWNCGKMEWKRVVYLVKYSHPLHFFNNFMAVVTSVSPTLCWLSKLEIFWSKPVWTVVTVQLGCVSRGSEGRVRMLGLCRESQTHNWELYMAWAEEEPLWKIINKRISKTLSSVCRGRTLASVKTWFVSDLECW